MSNKSFELFGWSISRTKPMETPSPVTPPVTGASVVTAPIAAYGYYGYSYDLDGLISNQNQLVNRYREISTYPDCDTAIEQIVNEAVIVEQAKPPVTLNVDQAKLSKGMKKKILDEFDTIIRLTNFNENCHDIFKRWYIDGRSYFYVVVDEKHPTKGILDVKYIDNLKIREVQKITKENRDGIEVVTNVERYYLFNDNGLQNSTSCFKLSPDTVVDVKSGLVDANSGEVISFLFKAIKPVNQLRMMEDATVIYRISRAPERRIFYVDVANLQPARAEQYVQDVMNKFRNKIVYDPITGEIKNNRNYLSMCEDLFLARREGGRSTEIQTLPGGCLAMDTKVSLLDGRELTISEIEAELADGKTLWTYSCHPETGKIVPGLISWAGVTQESAKVLRITLDNGETITCTPDHKFPIKGYGFKRADELAVNDSLIPLYRRLEPIVRTKSKKNKSKSKEYEQVFDNESMTWKFTHRIVAQEVADICNPNNIQMGKTIHHCDFNKFNNDPSNLKVMLWEDHRSLHYRGWHEFNEKLKAEGKWEEFQANATNTAREWWLSLDDETRQKYCEMRRQQTKDFWSNMTDEERDELRSKISVALKDFWNNMTDEQRARRAEISSQNVKKGNQALQEKLLDPEFNKAFRQKISDGWTPELRQQRAESTGKLSTKRWNEDGERLRRIHKEHQEVLFSDNIIKGIVDIVKGKTSHQVTIEDVCAQLNSNGVLVEELTKLNANKSVPNWDGKHFTVNLIRKVAPRTVGLRTWKEFRQSAQYFNHRIVAIEELPDPIQVGTLTIDVDEKYHNYHTFALSVGVFTKNSNLSDIADIEYFQRKLYQSMNVPLQRLLPDNQFSLGRNNEVTREEILFSKFIQRLRNNFNSFFFQLLKIQLISKRIIRPEEWEELRSQLFVEYQHDNYFEELKRSEIFRDRMELAQQADGYKGVYFSKDYIAKNILQFTEQEWDRMKQEMKAEADEEAGEGGNEGDEGDDEDNRPSGNPSQTDDTDNPDDRTGEQPDDTEEEVDVLTELEDQHEKI